MLESPGELVKQRTPGLHLYHLNKNLCRWASVAQVMERGRLFEKYVKESNYRLNMGV